MSQYAKDPGYFMSAYTPASDRPRPRVDPGIEEGQEGAQQQFKDECDVNRIMARFEKTGMAEWLNKHEGQYLDCTGFDFAAAMNVVAVASEMFADLPAKVRDRFKNDPQQFYDFVHNPHSKAELEELGLTVPAPAPTAPAVAPTPPAQG